MPLRKRNLEGIQPAESPVTRVVPVPGGIRLAQGDVVLSELRLLPGPTHSVFDVLASLVHRLAPPGEVAVLGFGAGGILAPMRALGCDRPLHAVDVDATGHRLFRQWCPAWAEDVAWRQADATAWLRGQRGGFACVLEDLSEPRDGDVHKPADCRRTLPRLIGRRLGRGGVAVFNLVPDADGSWPGGGRGAALVPVRAGGALLGVPQPDAGGGDTAAGRRMRGAMAAGGPAADGVSVGRADPGGKAPRHIHGSVTWVAVLVLVRATWATSRPWCGCRAWWPG